MREEITVNILDTTSLSETLDGFNEASFYGRKLSPAQAKETARWIASREGKPYGYFGLPSPTTLDHEHGARFFTGERITSRVGIRHILGEEASRALILLGVKDKAVETAIEEATQSGCPDEDEFHVALDRPTAGEPITIVDLNGPLHPIYLVGRISLGATF